MTSFLVILISTPLACWLTERLLARAIQRAHEQGALDHPTERGSHTRPTPRAGGRAFAPVVIGAALIAALSRLLASSDTPGFHTAALWALVLGGTAAAVIGHWDDIHRLGVRPKLIGQAVAAALAALLIGHFSAIRLAGLHVPLPEPLNVLLAFVCVGWMMNVVNFMDGMDGLVSTFVLACLAAFALLLALHAPGAAELLLTPAALAGALLAFHRRNVAADVREKTFMGDCGSQFLGLAVMVFALVCGRQAATGVADLTPALILFFPFLYDTTVTLVRRLQKGANILEAHHEHLYQRHLELGESHDAVLRDWSGMLARQLALAVLAIVFGSGSLVGWAALLVSPVPILRYHHTICERESIPE